MNIQTVSLRLEIRETIDKFVDDCFLTRQILPVYRPIEILHRPILRDIRSILCFFDPLIVTAITPSTRSDRLTLRPVSVYRSVDLAILPARPVTDRTRPVIYWIRDRINRVVPGLCFLDDFLIRHCSNPFPSDFSPMF